MAKLLVVPSLWNSLGLLFMEISHASFVG